MTSLVLVFSSALCALVVLTNAAGIHNVQSFNTKTNNFIGNDVTFPKIKETVNERFPSAVLFGRTCGGTIIGAKWILTAAHCTIFTGGRDILAGTNQTDDGSGVLQRVKKLYIHPRFTVGPYWVDADRYNIKQVGARFDFLLAELEKPLPLDGKTMVAAKLDDSARLTPGEHVGFAGFGAERHGETMRHSMHEMDLDILADDKCSDMVEFDPQDMICTVGTPPRRDTACNGDSGSGLMSNGKILGIASWVEDDAHTCRNGARIVFSRVAAARDWIRKITGI